MLAPALTAIRTYVEANYTALTLRWANEPIPSQRDAGTAYIEVEIIGGRNSIRAFSSPGSRLFIHPGLLRFYVMAPQNTGVATAMATADTLAALLERKELDAPTKPQIVRTLDFSTYDDVATSDDGNFTVLMCSVPFDFYYLN